MEQKLIEKIIRDYDDLLELAKNRLKIIEIADNKYNTARGVEDISFDINTTPYVCVKCDDSCMGCYDSLSFSFPLHWLSLSDEELKNVVIKEKIDEIKKEKLKNEALILRRQKEKEQQELRQYKRLKEKFKYVK